MEVKPEEKADALRGLIRIQQGFAKTKLQFSHKNNPLEFIISGYQEIIKKEIKSGNDFKYIIDGIVMGVSYTSLRIFAHSLIQLIDHSERDYFKRKTLKEAADSLKTMTRREMFLNGLRDPSRYFKNQYDSVIDAFERFSSELEDFPINIFTNYDFFISKEVLSKSRETLIKLISKTAGEDVYLANLLLLTTGLKRNSETLVFDPIAEYYTENKESQYFKNQLKKI